MVSAFTASLASAARDHHWGVSDGLQGLCHDEGRYTLCDITEIRIVVPDAKRVPEDERKLLQEFKKDPEKAKMELAKAAADLKDTSAKVRADPTLGPKARRNFEDLLAAETQDLKRWAHAAVESDCGLEPIPPDHLSARLHITDAGPDMLLSGTLNILSVLFYPQRDDLAPVTGMATYPTWETQSLNGALWTGMEGLPRERAGCEEVPGAIELRLVNCSVRWEGTWQWFDN